MFQRLTLSLVATVVLGIGASPPLLAQESEAGPVGIGGRVDIPEAGYALTAPDDWITVLPTAEDASGILEALSAIDPELASIAESALAGDVTFSLLIFGAYDQEAGFRTNCNVIDLVADGTPLTITLANDAAAIADWGERLAREPESTILELEAGTVARLDYALRYPAFDLEQAVYYYTDGSMLHLLTCTDAQRPADDWLSIAETFEFLPGTDHATGSEE